LTINPDFSFTAQGACNTMTGTLVADTSIFIVGTFNITTNNCTIPIYTDLDNSFFQFLQMNAVQYYIGYDVKHPSFWDGRI